MFSNLQIACLSKWWLVSKSVKKQVRTSKMKRTTPNLSILIIQKKTYLLLQSQTCLMRMTIQH